MVLMNQEEQAEGQMPNGPEVQVANGQPQENVPTYSEEEMQRIVKVECADEGDAGGGGEIFQVPWHLMMQSGVFAGLWNDVSPQKADDPIPLKEVSGDCFRKIVAWMGQHYDRPVPVVRENQLTGERIWFDLTDWERTFFAVDFEMLKELYMAANYLDIRSLYLYCAQECARCIMDKDEREIREMLCLPDDMTEAEKAAVRAEFQIADGTNGGAAAGGGVNGAAQQPANNGNGGGGGGGGGEAVQQQQANGNGANGQAQ